MQSEQVEVDRSRNFKFRPWLVLPLGHHALARSDSCCSTRSRSIDYRVQPLRPDIGNMSQTSSLNKPDDTVHDTLYSALHRFATPSASTSSLGHAPHPFGPSAHALATAELRDLITVTEQASLALGHHFAQSYADPKLVSILKQHTAISHALYQVCTPSTHRKPSERVCSITEPQGRRRHPPDRRRTQGPG